MTTCIDLRERFGSKYRIGLDESAMHEPNGKNNPWLFTIPATFGHFYPWGGGRIAFSTNNRGPTARMLAKLPFVRIEQDASDGYTLTFPIDRFNDFARIAKPKRRRVLSPEQREAAVKRLAKYQFSPAGNASQSPQIPTKPPHVDTLAASPALEAATP